MAEKHTNSLTSQNLPSVQITRAYRAAGTECLVIILMGGVIGGILGSSFAAWLYGNPWWLGKPYLPFSQNISIYFLDSIISSLINYYKFSAVQHVAMIAFGITLAVDIPFIFLGIHKMGKARKKMLSSDLHGSAHFADKDEIIKSGLFPSGDKKSDNKHVCYVGGWIDPKTNQQVYLQHSGPEHVLVHAPTRSGKGVGLVIPTLLSWQGSVLVNDIKGENFGITAGWRASIGQRVLRFAPTESEHSCHFNPLDEVRKGTKHETKDVQNLATIIVDPDGKGLNDHWSKTGFALLVSCILHVLYCREIESKTLASVGELLSDPDLDPDEGVDKIFSRMKEYMHDPDGVMGWKINNQKAGGLIATKVHPVIAQSAQDMLNKAANEKSGVISTTMSFLTLYRDPQVAEVISKSDFHVRDLMNSEAPISLYLVVPPSDSDRLKPLIRLIINQIIRRLTEEMDFEDGRSVAKYKHRLLLMIDEFPSLGKLDIFAQALAFIAGYGLKAYLICQDIAQLNAAYGKDESITSNAHVRIFYAPNRIETAEYVSKMLGKKTLTIESHSTSYAGQIALYQTGSSGGIQHVGRELLTPDEVLRLRGPEKNAKGDIVKPGDMIISSAGNPAILGTQILYFRDPVFARRSKIIAPSFGDSFAIPGGFKARSWGDKVEVLQPKIVEAEFKEVQQANESEQIIEQGRGDVQHSVVEPVSEIAQEIPSADEIEAAIASDDIPDFGLPDELTPANEELPPEIIEEKPIESHDDSEAEALVASAFTEADTMLNAVNDSEQKDTSEKNEGERIAKALKTSEDTMVKPQFKESLKDFGSLF